MFPERPPKSKIRYEMLRLGFSSDWLTALRPWEATVLSRVAVTSPSMVGREAPRSGPYAAAAARALAQDCRVAGLLRRPMSTTSASVSRRIRGSRSAGTEAFGGSSRVGTSGGGVHAVLGEGATPATPPTLGVPAHAMLTRRAGATTHPARVLTVPLPGPGGRCEQRSSSPTPRV